MTDTPKKDFDELVVDLVYDVALEPTKIEAMMEQWSQAGLNAELARQFSENADGFDPSFTRHLERAEKFLDQNSKAEPSVAQAALAVFGSAPAFVVDGACRVVEANGVAQTSFGLKDGDSTDALGLAPDELTEMEEAIRNLANGVVAGGKLLQLPIASQGRAVLFHLRRLEWAGPSYVLVFVAQYHWQAEMGLALEENFKVTAAEQGVVRALVEGADIKTIAQQRATSEGTVRAQVKSILAKMGAKSQAEVIRMTLLLRDVMQSPEQGASAPASIGISEDWLDAEVSKSFQSLVLPDGRLMEYHVQGPSTGAPILYSHAGNGIIRLAKPVLRLLYQFGLQIITPIRAGYGRSTNIGWDADVLQVVRHDIEFLLDHLEITSCPYAPQGNDLIFAIDLAGKVPHRVSEILGICARPYLPGDTHFQHMDKWQRFYSQTVKYSPKLYYYFAKAGIAMARKIGPVEVARKHNSNSVADSEIAENPVFHEVMKQGLHDVILGPDLDVSQALTLELIQTAKDWSGLMHQARDTPTTFYNGTQDPFVSREVIARYKTEYPWINVEIFDDAGQLLLFQKPEYLIGQFAQAAGRAGKM